jgi:hypothetical protein
MSLQHELSVHAYPAHSQVRIICLFQLNLEKLIQVEKRTINRTIQIFFFQSSVNYICQFCYLITLYKAFNKSFSIGS